MGTGCMEWLREGKAFECKESEARGRVAANSVITDSDEVVRNKLTGCVLAREDDELRFLPESLGRFLGHREVAMQHTVEDCVFTGVFIFRVPDFLDLIFPFLT